MKYTRMAIEKESPEELGYNTIANNLAESSVTDAVLGGINVLQSPSLQNMALLYTVHKGDEQLRQEILSLYGTNHGLSVDDVIVVPGAAAALFMIHTALLERESHIVVQHPNYGTNIETPKAIGCELSLCRLSFESQWRCTHEELLALVRPNTKLISITTPHNPTGKLQTGLVRGLIDTLYSPAADGSSANSSRRDDVYILCDETYRDVSDGVVVDAVAASLHPKVITVSSMSKAFGMPGIRIGWAICRDPHLQELLLAAKEQIFITNSVVDEEIGKLFLQQRQRFLPAIREKTAKNFGMLAAWMDAHSDLMEWVRPDGAAVVAFPRFKASARIDTAKFYPLLLSKYATVVGPGHWFDMPDEYMRVGYGWPSEEQMRSGLDAIAAAAAECRLP